MPHDGRPMSVCGPLVSLFMLLVSSICMAGQEAATEQEKPHDTLGLKPPKGAVVLIQSGKLPEQLVLEKDRTKAAPWEFDKDTGVLTVKVGSGDVCTKRTFQDFRLHLEFAVNVAPEGEWGNRGNSGVYLQRRYEVQILDSHGRELTNSDCGSLYRQRKPDQHVSRKAGEWQSFDIEFRAARFEDDTKTANARITVRHNGVLIHDDVELTAKTGAGLPEGPTAEVIRLQDHGNAVQFRNFWVVPRED